MIEKKRLIVNVSNYQMYQIIRLSNYQIIKISLFKGFFIIQLYECHHETHVLEKYFFVNTIITEIFLHKKNTS